MIFTVKTHSRSEMIDITAEINNIVQKKSITKGFCFIFVPHTTAAVTINENADPAVRKDLKTIFNKLIPWKDDYSHLEGNSAAHMKTTLVGSSETVAIENKKLILGTWQSVFFCEFDGPRNRKVIVKFIPAVDT